MPRSPRRATKLSEVRRTHREEPRQGLFDAIEGVDPHDGDLDLREVDGDLEGFALLSYLSHR